MKSQEKYISITCIARIFTKVMLDIGHVNSPKHIIQTQNMTPHPFTVYRHRKWQPTLSQYTDTGNDNLPRHSIQTLAGNDNLPRHSIQTLQEMTTYPITVYRHRKWQPTPSQYTDTGNDNLPRHRIQSLDMTPYLFTVYRLPTLS